jgi:dihydrodiol dehydrogenase / D-xylose 1-dehydrogenase (NADP)
LQQPQEDTHRGDKIGWGIIGTGKIAKAFASDLRFLPDAELVAVGSRKAESAGRFGEQFGVANCHASHQALANDPDVDVVYVATPHALHQEHAVLALEAGKAVLCEKPFTINATQAKTVISLARERKVFLMEAMWTRYIPLMVKLRELLAGGVIGELQILEIGMAFVAPRESSYYFFNPDLGGGILLDGGAYAVSIASMILGGPPARIASMAHLGETGVDEQSAAIFGYGGGQLAVIYVSFKTSIPPAARIFGSQGCITLHPPIFNPTRLTISRSGQQDEEVEIPFEGQGLHYEAAEVMRCLRAGELESEAIPLDETLAIMQTLDQIRAQWGLKYPME